MTRANLLKKAGCVFGTVACALTLFSSTGLAQSRKGLQLKLTGGIARLFGGGGDLSLFRDDTIARYNAVPGYQLDWSWKELTAIPEYDADLVYQFSKMFGIGLGIGYIKVTSNGDFTQTGGGRTNQIAEKFEIKTLPVRLNLFYQSSFKFVRFYAYGGLSYYAADLTRSRTPGDLNITASSETFGGQGGLGLGWDISRFLTLAFELSGKIAEFKLWRGDETSPGAAAESGPLWYYNLYDPVLNGSFGEMGIFNEEPSGPNYQNVRRAAIDLNSWRIAVSLITRFDFKK
jgi:hypothetical protein